MLINFGNLFKLVECKKVLNLVICLLFGSKLLYLFLLLSIVLNFIILNILLCKLGCSCINKIGLFNFIWISSVIIMNIGNKINKVVNVIEKLKMCLVIYCIYKGRFNFFSYNIF